MVTNLVDLRHWVRDNKLAGSWLALVHIVGSLIFDQVD